MARTWFSMKAGATANDPAEIAIYDDIGFWGINANDFRQALDNLGKPSQINLRINSPGGEVFDGIAIYNMLKRSSATVNVTVDGIAASIASYIAMAGDTITMPENATMMIHNPGGLVMGTAADMRDMANILDLLRNNVIGAYASKTGLAPDQVITLMDAETWMNASKAKELGFADVVGAPVKATSHFDLSKYRSVPTNLAKSKPPAKEMLMAAFACKAAQNLPLDESATWDGPAATERMLEAAGFDGDTPDPELAQRGFLVVDTDAADQKSSYKLPFADMIGGQLKAVIGGVNAASDALAGTDVPQSVKDEAQAVIDHYTASRQPDNHGSAVGNDPERSAGADLALQIASACELAGCTDKTAHFIASGKSLTVVMSELQAIRAEKGKGRNPDPELITSGSRKTAEEGQKPAKQMWGGIIERLNAKLK